MFKTKIKYLPDRPGETFCFSHNKSKFSNKIYKYYGKINLKDYIDNFIK